MRVAVALWSMAGVLVALAFVITLVPASPARLPSAADGAKAAGAAPMRVAAKSPPPTLDPAKRAASSSMLEMSGYAISKDKLD